MQSPSPTKRCTKCREEKPCTSEFFFCRSQRDQRSGRGKLQSACKECAKAASQRWRTNNRERVNRLVREWGKRNPDRLRDIQLRTEHGISKKIYDDMFSAQRGVCAICRQPETVKKSMPVDHDHATGAIRGLLCGLCNKGLGMFKDKTELLARAIRYLEWHRLTAKTNAA